MTRRTLSPQKTALLLFGVFFVVVMLIIALSVPNPTESQWRTFNIVLALVAAAIAAVLPGVLELQFTPWLKAGGALAVFALVYLVKPMTLVATDPFRPVDPPPPLEMARAAVDHWLSLNDSGKYADAYANSHPMWKKRYAEADFIQLSKSIRAPLGKVVSRIDSGQQAGESPIGVRGHARAYTFLTQFETVTVPVYEIVFVFVEEGGKSWAPAGYNLDVQKAQSSMKALAPLVGIVPDAK
jgi:hypothetical protein